MCSVVEEEIDALPVHGGSDKVKLAARKLREKDLPRFENDLMQLCVPHGDITEQEQYVYNLCCLLTLTFSVNKNWMSILTPAKLF